MEVKSIKTDSEYNTALKRVNELFDVTPDSPDFNEAELMISLVEQYEKEHYKMDAPNITKNT